MATNSEAPVASAPAPRESSRSSNLQIKIASFGPVESGQVELKPLTIFIGPNNSGKSYTAMLIHSVLSSLPFIPRSEQDERYFIQRWNRIASLRYRRKSAILRTLHLTRQENASIEKQLLSLKEEDEATLPSPVLDKLVKAFAVSVFQDQVSSEIAGSFASNLHDLKSVGAPDCTIDIRTPGIDAELKTRGQRLKLIDSRHPPFTVVFRGVGAVRRLYDVKYEPNRILIQFPAGSSVSRRRVSAREIVDDLQGVVAGRLFRSISNRSYYLPAARSGIMQGHRALAAAVFRRMRLAGLQEFRIPTFSGVVSDFISSVIEMEDDEKGPLFSLAVEFEKELIKGDVFYEHTEGSPYPEIKYRFGRTEIPLHRSSSTVSELAPLFLYLKYLVTPGSTLIIEEPEAHLHPENQRILAYLLARIVRDGVRVLVTTHSEFLIEQLNTLLKIGTSELTGTSPGPKGGRIRSLSVDDVACYLFRPVPDGRGNSIVAIPVDVESGISDEEFLNIHQSLYEDMVRMTSRLAT